MDQSLIPIGIGLAVIAVVAVIGFVSRPAGEAEEQRLDEMSGRRKKTAEAAAGSLLKTDALQSGGLARWVEKFLSVESFNRLYDQADVGFSFKQFLMICGAVGFVGVGIPAVLRLPIVMLPVSGLFFSILPFFWLLMRRRKRIKKFLAQMPDAMELVARALRAGHGLASGLKVVADEMPPPISHEFGRIFEEQNLGIPMEDAMRALAERVPAMDVRFFVTAVVIQRSTGGDLAEILDKIGALVRERFKILGQVAALTGEGRLSGAVLLAMPPALLAFTYSMNPDYTGLLFTTEIGKKMLIVTAVLQIVGALAIKKIVAIKV